MRAILLALAVCIVVPAHAITPAQIERAAKGAHNGLRTVVKKLASKKIAGRDNSTPGSLLAQTYLIRKLRRLGRGLGPGSGDAAFKQPFTHLGQTGTNILAVMRGTDLANEYVMIGGHYDHLNSRSDPATGRCSASAPVGGEICNGAADNAAGVAATLAIAKALKKAGPTRRSVILAFWDSEEDDLNGSAYYAANPLVPNDAVKGYLNFDLQGANLLPSLKNTSFAIGAETGGPAFDALVADAIAPEGLGTVRLSYIFGQLRSDYVNLVSAGIPTVFFTDANNGCYHTVNDDVEFVDFKKLRRQTHIGFRTAAALTETASPPGFVPPSLQLATFTDLERVGAIVAAGRVDLGLLQPADQALATSIDANLRAMIADGPAAFDQADVATLLQAGIDTVNALRRVPCQKF